MTLTSTYHGHATFSVATGATGTILTVPAGTYGFRPALIIGWGIDAGGISAGNYTMNLVRTGGATLLIGSAGGLGSVQVRDPAGEGLGGNFADVGFTITLHVTTPNSSGSPQRGVISLALIDPLGGNAGPILVNATDPQGGTIDISAFPTQADLGGLGVMVAWASTFPSTLAQPTFTGDAAWVDLDVAASRATSAGHNDIVVTIGLMATPPTPRYGSWSLAQFPTLFNRGEVLIILDAPGTYTPASRANFVAIVG